MEQSMNLPNPVPRPAEAFALLIETACREFETLQSLLTGGAQHVSMDLEWQLGGLAKPFNQLLRTALGVVKPLD
jgi:hypothetical protein